MSAGTTLYGARPQGRAINDREDLTDYEGAGELVSSES